MIPEPLKISLPLYSRLMWLHNERRKTITAALMSRVQYPHTSSSSFSQPVINMFVISKTILWLPTPLISLMEAKHRDRRGGSESVFLWVPRRTQKRRNKRRFCQTVKNDSCVWTALARPEEPPRCGLTLASAALCTPRSLILYIRLFLLWQ